MSRDTCLTRITALRYIVGTFEAKLFSQNKKKQIGLKEIWQIYSIFSMNLFYHLFLCQLFCASSIKKINNTQKQNKHSHKPTKVL